MRLLRHINEASYETAGRSVPIDFDKGVELIKKECKSALNAFRNNRMIYRGVNADISDILYIEPSKHVRVSANTANIYTLLIDNSKRWSAYPKRSQSIICSNSTSEANGYGAVHVVFPKDGFKIGICPANDMWLSFHDLGMPLDSFNFAFIEFIRSRQIKVRFDDFKDFAFLRNICEEIDKQYASLGDDMFIPGFLHGYKGNLLEHLDNLLDPRDNRFKVVNRIENAVDGVKELWTDADCYLVRNDEVYLKMLRG